MSHPADDHPTGDPEPPTPEADATGVDLALLERLRPYLGESIMVLDADWSVKVNLAPPGGLIGRGLGLGVHTLEDMHPDDAVRVMDLGVQAFATEPGWSGSTVVRMCRGDGSYGRYEITATMGEVFGLTETLSNLPYDASLVTVTACRFDCIRRELFLDFLQNDPQACFRLLEIVANTPVTKALRDGAVITSARAS